MKATYGAYNHDDEHVIIRSCFHQSEWNRENGALVGESVLLSIEWELKAATQDDLHTKIAAAQTAYATQGQDFVAKLDSGADSVHDYANADYGPTGIRVVRFGYADGARPLEYATRRTLTADLICGEPIGSAFEGVEVTDPGPSPGGTPFIYAFEESISVSGGIPAYRLIPMPGGPVIAFQEAASTPEITVVRGRAMATGGFAAATTVPAGLLLDKVVEKGRVAGQPNSFIISWSYTVAN